MTHGTGALEVFCQERFLLKFSAVTVEEIFLAIINDVSKKRAVSQVILLEKHNSQLI